MATRIGVMSEGQILQVGRPGDIYETPNCRFVADFIGSVNMFKGSVTVDEPDHVVIDSPECRHYVSHGITGTSGMDVHVAIRPEKIGIQKKPPRRRGLRQRGRGWFQLRCGAPFEDLAYLGSQTIYHVALRRRACGEGDQANDARHDESGLAGGDPVHVWWWGSDVVVLTQ